MSGRSDRVPSPEELSERAETNEPLVDTPVLNAWAEMDLPMRGEARENIIQRMREQLRNRRTVEGIASRIAANATSPITNAIEEEAQDRVRGRVEETLKEQAGRVGDGERQ